MISIVSIGRVKEKELLALIQEYDKRMKPIHTLNLIELANSNHRDTEHNAIRDDESQRILAKIDSKDFVVLLDLRGKDLSSPAMSQKLMAVLDTSKPIVFVIGGSHGVNDAVRERANFMWKLSNLTFPHQLVRLMLYEQIYRMFMISRNHPYHK